jgi:hypothetical protein
MSLLLSPGLLVELAGIGLVLLGWLLFRRSGVAFWTFAPVWRANHYLKAPGVLLWVVGLVVAWVGLVHFLLHFAR